MDYVLRGLALDNKARFFIGKTTELVRAGTLGHNCAPTAAAALGRTLTMGTILGMTLKGEEKMAISFKGDGPNGNILVETDATGNVRGYISNPQEIIPLKENGKLDVSTAVGFGFLYVIKDLGMKEPYTSSVPIVSGEIGEDFAEYFYSSEQVPSAVGLGVLVNKEHGVISAGGFLFQLLPEADEDTIIHLEEILKKVTNFSAYMGEHTPEDFLNEFFPDNYEILEKREVDFVCSCSKEKYGKGILTLGKKEIENLIQENEEGVEVVCHYCNKPYVYSRADLENLIKEL